VRVLTDSSGISQPAVSKHLGVLKLAGLVRNRREGRETHYSAQPQGLAPMIDWMSLYGAFGATDSIALKPCSARWTNEPVRRRAFARHQTRVAASAGKALARSH